RGSTSPRAGVRGASRRPPPPRPRTPRCEPSCGAREYDPPVQQKYVLTELESGERVISERLPPRACGGGGCCIPERLAHVRSVAIGFWIGAGSRDETDAKAGISHFIEHLLFKGTASY